jgi:hypothetical protein
VSRALREVLEAFASEAVASEILVNALADGGFEKPPETADDLDDLLQGSLRTELTAVLGEEVADAVAEGLRPVLLMMRRIEAAPPPPLPRTQPPEPLTQRPPPGRDGMGTEPAPSNVVETLPPPRAPRPPRPSGAELVAVSPARSTSSALEPRRPPTFTGAADLAILTTDQVLVERVSRASPGRTVLVADGIEGLRKARVVLVDTRSALDALRAPWTIGVAPQVAILWPADTADRTRFEALQPHVPRVVCAGPEAEADDVALLVQVQLTAK